MPVDVPGGSPSTPTTGSAAGTVTPAAPAEGTGGAGPEGDPAFGDSHPGTSRHAADRKAARALRRSPAVHVTVRGPRGLQGEAGPEQMQSAARGQRPSGSALSPPKRTGGPGSLHPLEAAHLQTFYAEHAARRARTARPTHRGTARAAAGHEGRLLVRLVHQALEASQADTSEQTQALALLRTFADHGVDRAGVRPELLSPGTLSELRVALEMLLVSRGLVVLRRFDRRVFRSTDGSFSWSKARWPDRRTLGGLALRVGALGVAASLVVLWLSWLR